MGFLKRLFGGRDEPYVDKRGIYLYVACERCGSRLRVRVDKQFDLNRQNGGYIWRKSLVDGKCFRPMETVVTFDGNYEIVTAEIDGGRYLSEAEFDALEQAEAERAAAEQDDTETDLSEGTPPAEIE